MTKEGRNRPERDQTNESLRTEREKTDRALADKHAVERNADDVVHRARDNADAVLGAARDLADRRLGQPAPLTGTDASVAAERVLEDDIVRGERASADEALQREREESSRVLASLLPLERDKTDRYLLSERARSDDAVSNRDDFLGIVSHDLRNLLGGIVMGTGLLSSAARDDDEGKQTRAVTARIQRYAARMNRLVGDLVDIASIDAGKLAMTLQRGDVVALVMEAADTFHAAATEKDITLATQLDGAVLPAMFDHDRMLQVLANLITNSIKFTAPGGTIQVRGESAGGDVRVCVSDTGTGIPRDMLESVFERFRQVTKNDRRGLGLGLYISRCIVEAHGGRIWAESEQGKGTTLCFTLPVAAS
jgi:signal transduction histidine kinase